MNELNQRSKNICLEYSLAVKNKFTDPLYDYKELELYLAAVEKQKSDDHFQYKFDLVSNEILTKYLETNKLNVKLYTEESGWLDIGHANPDLIIICDPFDQSFLSTKTFRGASVGICVFDSSLNFLSTAISDLNTHLIYFADTTGAYAFYPKSKTDLTLHNLNTWKLSTSKTNSISDAFVIFPGDKQNRREAFLTSRISKAAARLLNIDGLINLGRLAGGFIDAFLDPYLGQPVYEIIYAEIALKAGAIVTDNEGHDFSSANLAKDLMDVSTTTRYRIVASCSRSLHNEILDNL